MTGAVPSKLARLATTSFEMDGGNSDELTSVNGEREGSTATANRPRVGGACGGAATLTGTLYGLNDPRDPDPETDPCE